jgi:hypothetical protein
VDQGIIGVVDLGWRMLSHTLVGPAPLTLAILAAYGLLMKGVRAQAIGRDTRSAIFHAVVGLLTIPVLVVLLFLWSVAMDLSVPWSLFVWSATLASGHGCARFATKWQHGRAELADSLRVAA